MEEKSLLLFMVFVGATVALELQQVFIFSRHNIRTPMAASLQQYTPKIIPKWLESPKHLTAKGGLMEEYMGGYFSDWFQKEGFLTNDDCREPGAVFLYANNRQRTIETARRFGKTLFENCNITVHHETNADGDDPVFSLVFTNKTEDYKRQVITEMQEKIDASNLTDAYTILNKILDFNKSPICIEKSLCNLTKIRDVPVYNIGEEPNIDGPLQIGNAVVDLFLMQYYGGASCEEIAWGSVNSETFKILMKISRENLNVRFNTTIVSKLVTKKLLDYMSDVIINDSHKLTALFGHDANLVPLIKEFGFKPFSLPEQQEATPVGGKIVFQKWYDKESKKKLMKVNYIYPSMKQLWSGRMYSAENPPMTVQLEMKNCPTDAKGFCLYSDFIKNVLSMF